MLSCSCDEKKTHLLQGMQLYCSKKAGESVFLAL